MVVARRALFWKYLPRDPVAGITLDPEGTRDPPLVLKEYRRPLRVSLLLSKSVLVGSNEYLITPLIALYTPPSAIRIASIRVTDGSINIFHPAHFEFFRAIITSILSRPP